MPEITIDRQGTVEQIARALAERILDGEIRPGVALRESVLAERIGVSRNSMREAIRGLVPDGLVRHIPNRGFVVTEITPDDVDDLYRGRAVLEIGAMRESFSEIRRRASELEDILDGLLRQARDGNWRRVFDEDRRFHAVLVEATGSTRLLRFHGQLFDQLRLALIQVDRWNDDPERLHQEHQAVLDPLVRGDRRSSVRALRRHLEDAARQLREHLLRGPQPPPSDTTGRSETEDTRE